MISISERARGVTLTCILLLMTATSAATVKLTVPALAAMGGVAFLGEPVTLRLCLTSVAILGGNAFFILNKGVQRTG